MLAQLFGNASSFSMPNKLALLCLERAKTPAEVFNQSLKRVALRA